LTERIVGIKFPQSARLLNPPSEVRFRSLKKYGLGQEPCEWVLIRLGDIYCTWVHRD
jgi:hypothetical protein